MREGYEKFQSNSLKLSLKRLTKTTCASEWFATHETIKGRAHSITQVAGSVPEIVASPVKNASLLWSLKPAPHPRMDHGVQGKPMPYSPPLRFRVTGPFVMIS